MWSEKNKLSSCQKGQNRHFYCLQCRGGEGTSTGSVLSLENFERVAGGILPGASIAGNVSIQMNYNVYTSNKSSSNNVTLSPNVSG